MSQLTKYLANYAEQEVQFLADFPQHIVFDNVVVIPAYKESSDFVKHFIGSDLSQQNVLMVVVINQPDSEPDSSPQHTLFNDILKLGEQHWQYRNLSLVNFHQSNSSCLIVDRFRQGIDKKFGVGLARKVGADIAAALIDKGCVNSEWIHSTDADASMPTDYFRALNLSADNNSKNVMPAAACYNFFHYCDDEMIHQANHQYETALRYYVAGLRYANSPYAFFTIGSVLAFTAKSYANVRGFPKKCAGEDFYLLNKLAKLGQVLWLPECKIQLEARTSDRVPFGTGPAVAQILELQQQNKSYCYYHPEVFELLKQLYAAFESLHLSKDNLMPWYEHIDPRSVRALITIGFEGFVSKQQRSTEAQFNKQLAVWFDAFKTLKYIHYLKEHYLPDVPLTEAIAQASFEIT